MIITLQMETDEGYELRIQRTINENSLRRASFAVEVIRLEFESAVAEFQPQLEAWAETYTYIDMKGTDEDSQ